MKDVWQGNELKDFLEEAVERYNTKAFIEGDPIEVPHLFTKKEDKEIAGFFAATLAWGKRSQITKAGFSLINLMDNEPFDFVLNHSLQDLKAFDGFVYRTFQPQDARFFVAALKNIYLNHGGLEEVFTRNQTSTDLHHAIAQLRRLFLTTHHEARSRKHIADTASGSAAKRMHMFLRWMVRKDRKGVDFGIWHQIPMSILSCPLDTHVAAIARQLGLLQRKQNDLKAVNELDSHLRTLDSQDPAKYDFALFGLGMFGGLK
jgi:uncharacterized protein (TIGR02757 family)